MLLCTFSKTILTKAFNSTWLYPVGRGMSSTSNSTSNLAVLRQRTGYSISNCKKALSKFKSIDSAEYWLHEEAKKEGWAKIANLQHRSVSQGVVAVYSKGNIAAMVEVNCETDFVARNAEFQTFVSKALSSCLNYTLSQPLYEEWKKFYLNSQTVNQMKFENTSLADLTATAIGKFGERALIRRAVCFKTASKEIFLESFTHPATPCANFEDASIGKFGSIVAYCDSDDVTEEITDELMAMMGQKLCKQIVGMNPKTIGRVSDALDNAVVYQEKEVQPKTEEEVISEVTGEDKLLDSNESCLVHQQYLFDPSMNVGLFLKRASLEVLDFHRFECGEEDPKCDV